MNEETASAEQCRTHTSSRKRARSTPSEKRRADRIRMDIDSMEQILERSGKLQKKDRHSILASAVRYIKELENTLGENANTWSRPTDNRGAPANGPNQQPQPYHGVFTGHGLPQLIIDSTANIRDCNSMFCWLSKDTRTELCGRSLFDLIPIHDRRRLQGFLEELGQLCPSSEVKLCAKSFQQKLFLRNSILDVFLTFSYGGILDNGIKGFTCTVLPSIYTDQPESSSYILNKEKELVFLPEYRPQSNQGDCALRFVTNHSAGDLRIASISSLVVADGDRCMLSSPGVESTVDYGRDGNSHLSPHAASMGSGDNDCCIVPDTVAAATARVSSEPSDADGFDAINEWDVPFSV